MRLLSFEEGLDVLNNAYDERKIIKIDTCNFSLHFGIYQKYSHSFKLESAHGINCQRMFDFLSKFARETITRETTFARYAILEYYSDYILLISGSKIESYLLANKTNNYYKLPYPEELGKEIKATFEQKDKECKNVKQSTESE